MDVFELLYQEKKPVTADELGTKNKFHPARLSRLLNALTALKLVKKSVQGEKGDICSLRAISFTVVLFVSLGLKGHVCAQIPFCTTYFTDFCFVLSAVLYCNTRAGELLSKSDPQTFRAMPSWNKMFANFLSSLPKKVKISEEDGENLLFVSRCKNSKVEHCPLMNCWRRSSVAFTEKSKKPEEPKECARSEDPGSGHDSDHQHGGEGDHWDTADWPDFFEMYQGFHNFVAPQAKKLVTQYDLSAYKSCMDLGGWSQGVDFSGGAGTKFSQKNNWVCERAMIDKIEIVVK